MSYKIIIEKTQEVTIKAGKEWKEVGQVEKPREPQIFDGEDSPKTYMSTVYDYTPEIEKTITQTLSIYEQVVDDLNLANVIFAVNGLSK